MALGLPWVTFSPSLTLPTMYATGQLLCTSAATATCAPTSYATAGLALLAAACLSGLLSWLLACTLALLLHNLGAGGRSAFILPWPVTEAALGFGLLAVPLALAGVVMGYIGTASFQAFIPPGFLAQARAGPSPGGAAAILGLLCLLAGCAALALAGDAMPAAAAPQGKQDLPQPPPLPYPTAAQGSPGMLLTTRSERAASPTAQYYQQQESQRRLSIYEDLGEGTLVGEAGAGSHALAYTSAVERLVTFKRAALAAEEEVRAVESAMRERVAELSLRDAQAVEGAEGLERARRYSRSASDGGSGFAGGALQQASSASTSGGRGFQAPSRSGGY